MRRRFSVNSYQIQRWFKNAGAICAQFIIPLTIFQGIRTLFFPTTFDVFLLAIFALCAVAIYMEWI
ncbi:hypothetical protein [Bacillus sp. CGMCC 1.16541]|uniref:hypothetical protein n=1 Tax=Bacillus sp. CGMCC 1.16541 TaxID=2185143 RepID=UPI000D73BD05|nr:hypothetical protein [Bacillus sp. CGMCC 1.16541]